MAATLVNTVWIELLRAQRPMQYADIAAALPELSHNQRAPALKVAFQLGYIERTGQHRSYTYAVTPRCNVPPGVQVREILEATT
jgi:predicted MarR family transcription regulator